MKIFRRFVDTRKNNENFAITPYLHGFIFKGQNINAFGFGICFGYYAIGLDFVFGLPKKYKDE